MTPILKFPGDNKLKISRESMIALLRDTLLAQIDTSVRITDVDWPSYSNNPIEVTFTSDPEPDAPADQEGAA